MNPLMLAASILGKPFLIYMQVMDHTSLLVQNNELGFEQASTILALAIKYWWKRNVWL